MKKAFDTRAIYKLAGNPIQEVIKTFTNSNWGKLIEGNHPYTWELIDRKNLDKFMIDHFNMIVNDGIHIIGNKALIKMNKETETSWGY